MKAKKALKKAKQALDQPIKDKRNQETEVEIMTS